MGGNPPLALELRLDAVGLVLYDGLSYSRAARVLGISKTEVGYSVAMLLPRLAEVGVCQPDGSFVRSLCDLEEILSGMGAAGEAVCVDGLGTHGQRPRKWGNQKPLYDVKRGKHTMQGGSVSTVHGDLLWLAGAWPGSTPEQEMLVLSGLEDVLERSGVAAILDRGFRGMAKGHEHWFVPTGDKRTKDRLTTDERTYNAPQARLRALVEQSIGHLANAWGMRRWRGRLARVQQVFYAVAALVSLGRWVQRVPA